MQFIRNQKRNVEIIHRLYIRKSRSSFFSTNEKPFDKILIANRGEIACRVIKTAKRLGIKTVALYSNIDGRNSIHAKMADEAYQIGSGPNPSESYLLGDEILNVALKTGAEAIHPGYGFLSENSHFCQSTLNQNLVFIGPSPSAILAMGSKSEAKAIMADANVPVTPGYHGADQDPDYLLHEAVTKIGFPLLIKATMGGGGKGMRIVWEETEFLSCLDSCRRESMSAFGDSNVILEKYLVNPRHIEVQIMADRFGNVVHLFERDCSLQRRHQKIIEEAPASDLCTHLRREMGVIAKRAAKAVDYVNAGTVEFLLDTQSNEDNFYFCEMNTRLQVEHPVTEMITRQDLVEWQLRIASGEILPITDQSLIPSIGHAMEARVYAENPSNDFLPAVGQVWHHNPPTVCEPDASGTSVRTDSGLESGQKVTVHYDPMISKLIVHGETREDARKGLISSLMKYQIDGVPTNIPFLIQCAQHPTFRVAGNMNTGFLEEHLEELYAEVKSQSLNELEQGICSIVALLLIENRLNGMDIDGPWSNHYGSWRLGGSQGRFERTLIPVSIDTSDEIFPQIKCTSNRDGSFDLSFDNGKRSLNLVCQLEEQNEIQIVVDSAKRSRFTIVTHVNNADVISVSVWSHSLETKSTRYAFRMRFQNPQPSLSSLINDRDDLLGSGETSLKIKAPMPGKISRINISEGEKVERDAVVMVMEAMKMEHKISAPLNGVLKKINFDINDIVESGDILAEFEGV